MKNTNSQTTQKPQEQTDLAKLTINGHFIGDTLEVKKAGRGKTERGIEEEREKEAQEKEKSYPERDREKRKETGCKQQHTTSYTSDMTATAA